MSSGLVLVVATLDVSSSADEESSLSLLRLQPKVFRFGLTNRCTIFPAGFSQGEGESENVFTDCDPTVTR